MTEPVFFDAAAVRERLSIEAAIPLMREAMSALSAGRADQLLRSFIPLGEGRTFALMPAAMKNGPFGAKLVSVFADPGNPGRKAHEGLVILFDGETGKPACVADGGEITRIRTAAASAAATSMLARRNASRLAVLGLGAQAAAHIEAMGLVRELSCVRVWGRDAVQANRFASEMETRFGLPVLPCLTAREAVEAADIVCTVTAAADPVLEGAWLGEGVHVNLVGSSGPMAAEADAELVARSRFIADHREHVLAHGGEFLRAKAEGRVEDGHVAAEIGEVFAGIEQGRRSDAEITVYKSLGHAVQDIAAAAWLAGRAMKEKAA